MDYLTQLLSSYGNYVEVKKQNKGKSIPEPIVASKITVGFNSSVLKLEKQAAPNREKILKTAKKARLEQTGYTKYVFVAKSDITTLLLTDCFPLLTFAASKSQTDRVKLVELPKGATNRLLKTLNIPNASILTLKCDWEEGKPLFDLIDSKVPDVDVPWLQGIFDDDFVMDRAYKKPAIGFVKTSAPIGPRKPKKAGGRPKVEKAKVEKPKD